MNKPAKIFLSYASSDRVFAARLSKEIAKTGARTYDMSSLQAGEHIFDTFRKELNAADLFVLLVPPHEGEGRNALFEIGAAKALDKRILAVLPERKRFANSGFASSLSDFSMLDASNLSMKALASSIVSSAGPH